MSIRRLHRLQKLRRISYRNVLEYIPSQDLPSCLGINPLGQEHWAPNGVSSQSMSQPPLSMEQLAATIQTNYLLG